MSKIKLSDYIAKRLKEHNVKHFFMVSGGGAMHLNDSLGRAIPYTACHHEQACAIAAEGYARINQKLGVVNVTTGPGGLNCLNGVFGQWTDSVPVLYISGQVKFTTTMASCPDIPLRQLGDQEVDIISSVKHLTKYSKMVTEPNEIKYHIDRAIHEATTGRMGPVWLDIPMNVQGAMIEEDDLIEFDSKNLEEKKESLDINQIRKIVEKLQSAKRPIIVAGNGIHLAKQEENFYKLVEKFDIPVVSTFNAVDIIPSNHPNYCGRITTVGTRAGNFTLQNADVILFLGTRNSIRQASYNWENFAKKAYKIVVDIDKAELDKPTVVPDMKVCADLADFIPKLYGSLEICDTGDSEYNCDIKPDQLQTSNINWLKFCQCLRDKYSFENTKEYKSQNGEINAYDFVHKLTEAMQENDIMVTANGSACVCAYQAGTIKTGQRIFWNSGDASMGYGLPAAVGAYYGKRDGINKEDNNQAANYSSNIICLEGDGSIMMNIQELQTVVFNKIPLKLFVINNNGYSSIRQTQRNFFNGHMTGSGVDSGVSVPDFVEVGKAFGLKTKRISNPKTMMDEIKEVLNAQGAVLCEVMTEKEYSFSPKLSARKLPDGTMVSPTLEDMFPFLPRDEYEANILQ